jgi:hypothetical protein
MSVVPEFWSEMADDWRNLIGENKRLSVGKACQCSSRLGADHHRVVHVVMARQARGNLHCGQSDRQQHSAQQTRSRRSGSVCHERRIGKVDQIFHDERGTCAENNPEKLESVQAQRTAYLKESSEPELPKESVDEREEQEILRPPLSLGNPFVNVLLQLRSNIRREPRIIIMPQVFFLQRSPISFLSRVSQRD